MPTYRFGGRTITSSEALSPEEIQQAMERAGFMEAPAEERTPPKPELTEDDILARMFSNPMGAAGMEQGIPPQASRPTTAFLQRTVPPLVAKNPLLSGLLGAGGEAAAEITEGRDLNPLEIGVAGVIPPAAATAGRLARGVGRTATRLIPSRFAAAQQEARGGLAETIEALRPGGGPEAMAQARSMASEVVPVGKLHDILNEADFAIAPDVAEGGLKSARSLIDRLRTASEGGTLTLQELNQFRTELNALIQSHPQTAEFRALQRGVLESLEGATATGPGAAALDKARLAFRKDAGVSTLEKMTGNEPVTHFRAGQEPSLNIAGLERKLADPKVSADLTRQLGPEGVAKLQAFVTQYRSLPPESFWSGQSIFPKLTAAAGLIPGAMAGGPLGAPVGGMASGLLAEFLANAYRTGANPAALNRLLTGLGLTAGAGARGLGEALSGRRESE